MTRPSAFSENNALFLTPEDPRPGTGGGGLRSASLLEYLRASHDVRVATFTLPHHSRTFAARAWRNGVRMLRGVPPLLDRFSGCEAQLEQYFDRRYKVAVIEHFWCAPYAAPIRPHCDVLVLDLHNVESELALSHARATQGPEALLHRRFAAAYRRLEEQWISKFDVVLAASEADRIRIAHPNTIVYPNALPWIDAPMVETENCIIFSGNLEYHPNIEAVRWFAQSAWPVLRANNEGLIWKLVGRNQEAVTGIVGGDPRILLTGPVDDAVAEIARARVVVVPLLSGSGTRFKILEAWAAKRAVVSTPIGAEGLEARGGEHLLLAKEKFAQTVQQLLGDPQQAAALGETGRRLYEQKYTWPAAWKRLEGAGF